MSADACRSARKVYSQPAQMTPEVKARLEIDAMFTAPGWVVSDYKEPGPSAVRGIDFQQIALQADNLGTDRIRPAVAKEISL